MVVDEKMLAGFVAVALAVVKALEVAIVALARKVRGGGDAGDTDSRVKAIHDLLTRTDEDGVPYVYSSRTLAKAAAQMVEGQNKATRALDHLTALMGRIEREREQERRQLFELIQRLTERAIGN